MNSKTNSNRAWMSILIRLVLVASLLTMTASTAVSRASSGDDSSQARGLASPREQGQADQHHEIRFGPVEPKREPAVQPQAAIEGTSSMQPLAIGPGTPIQGPIDLKLLVISADGQETDFAAITTFLNQLGVPYDTFIASQRQLVQSVLWEGIHGYYQGILLCSGSLSYFNGQQYVNAFDSGEWSTLWEYERLFGVRQVTLYTNPYGYPENYGLNLVTSQDTSVTPLRTQLTAAGQQVFSYLNSTMPITIEQSYTYLATVISPTATTPLLVTSDGYAIASVTTYSNGRENLAITAANSPYLMHSMLLSYGIINWVTNGLFLGERHVNFDAQVDDMLIGDDIWDTVTLTDTTGLSYRMTGSDLTAVLAWQNAVRSAPNSSNVRLEWVFNGEGTSGMYSPDTLTPAVITNQGQFNWVNHTYSHANLDAISYSQATTELSQNHNVATNQLHLTRYYRDALVQPDVSGLSNSEFLRAAANFGLRYLIADTSRPGWNNPSPNVGFYSTYQPSLLIIPRRPANLFYNVSTPTEWVSEYNYFYGPGGIWPYWDHNLTYAEILDKESSVWLDYLLRWDLDPLMFHQSNTRAYSGNQSLLGDLITATLAKYNRYYNLPIRNLSEHEVGINMANRMAYNASGVRATILPCSVITLTTISPALIPITGIAYGSNTEVYGGQNISYIQLNANQTLVLPAPPPCQKITFGPLANKTYGDPPFPITATASSGLTVTFTSGGSCLVGPSTLSGTLSLATTTITATGTCTITATQPGNAIYNPATPVTQTFTISRANQTITFGSLASKTYGDPPFPITATASSNLTVTFATAGPCLVGASRLNGITSTATITLTGAGSCAVTASQSGNANYYPATPVTQTFTISRANQIITFGTLAAKTYGDPPFPITATASSNLTVTFAATGQCLVGTSRLNGITSTATITLTGAGSCDVTASQSGNANYYPATPVTQTFTISRANQTITFGSLANKTYGTPPFPITATASSNLTVTFAAAGQCLVGASRLNGITSTATITLTGAGSCAVTASQSGDANYYPATPVTQTFTIRRAFQSIAFEPLPDKTFLDPPFVITGTASSNLPLTFEAVGPCLVSESTFDGDVSTAIVTLTGAGNCAVTASQSGDINFDPAPAVSREFIIARAGQTITFDPLADKTFLDPPFTITATASSNLTVTFAAEGPCLVSESTFSGVASSAIVTIAGNGTCAITASQSGDANYSPATSVMRTFEIIRHTIFLPLIARSPTGTP